MKNIGQQCIHKPLVTNVLASAYTLTELSFTLYTAPNAPLPSCCLLSFTSLADTLFSVVTSSNIYEQDKLI